MSKKEILINLAKDCGLVVCGWDKEYDMPITIGTVKQRRAFEQTLQTTSKDCPALMPF